MIMYSDRDLATLKEAGSAYLQIFLTIDMVLLQGKK